MAAATTKMVALNSAPSSKRDDPNTAEDTVTTLRPARQESNVRECRIAGGRHRPRLHDELTRGHTANGALVKGQRHPKCHAKPADHTIRDERDRTTPTSGKATAASETHIQARTATDDYRRDNVEAGVVLLHTGSA